LPPVTRCTGGSVRRWAMNRTPPTNPITIAASTPADGCSPVARKVASTGPTMKIASSRNASTE
jgi:hypothetical protein